MEFPKSESDFSGSTEKRFAAKRRAVQARILASAVGALLLILVVGIASAAGKGSPGVGKGAVLESKISATATYCPSLVVDEGFESGTLGGFVSEVATCVPGGCGWAAVTATPRSGKYSAFVPAVDNVSDQQLRLATPIMPGPNSVLMFWHRYDLEHLYDGGVLERSTDGGNTWLDMGQDILSGGYNGTLSVIHPFLGGRQAWTGKQASYTQVVVRLSQYTGQSLLIRFRLGTDLSIGTYGWQIDDVSISSAVCTTATSSPTQPADTSTPLSSATATSCSVTAVLDEGFDSGTLGRFVNDVATCVPGGCQWLAVSPTPHTGTYSAFAPDVDDVADQRLRLATPIVPGVNSVLTFWHRFDLENTFDGGVLEGSTTGGSTWFDMGEDIRSGGYNGTLSVVAPILGGRQAWTGKQASYTQVVVSLERHIGQNLIFRFRLGTDWSVGGIGWQIDDIEVHTSVCPSPTPTATATCLPSQKGWIEKTDLPRPNSRSAGVYFPPNGKFYLLGGRRTEDAGNAQRFPYEYDIAADSWTAMSALFSDQRTSDVVGGVVTMNGTPVIVLVGGTVAGNSTSTGETRLYNPATDTMTWLPDSWIMGSTSVPGGVAVVNNKLYILGGYTLSGGVLNQIWEFNPNGIAGSRWTLKSTVMPVALGYVPAAAIGGAIYMAGGASWNGSNLVDTTHAYKYDPAANTITAIASIPRATSNTRALNIYGKMWVLGGGLGAPNPSNQVNVYDPATDSWTTQPSFTGARRNFAADTDGMGRVILAGGYGVDGLTILDDTQVYLYGEPCVGVTATVTPTVTATLTATYTATIPSTPSVVETVTATNTATATTMASATATTCTLEFTDVPPGHTFYEPIMCLACRGYISGYTSGCETGDPCYRPGSNVTRGQLAKVVSNVARFSEPAGEQLFEDVVPGSTFYDFVQRLGNRGYISGYACGGPGEPCVPPDDRPYFRVGANATRGQIAKIVYRAAGYADPVPSGRSFEDVVPGSTFYDWVQRMAKRGFVSGYACGGPGEPCIEPSNRPYFRPNNPASRGQTAKMVAETFVLCEARGR